jgi:hypothetical protein
MNDFGNRCVSRHLISVIIAAGILTFCPPTIATEAVTPEDLPAPENSLPGPLGLGVTGASAGITTDYFEQTVVEALVASGIFSEIDNSKSASVVMPMIRAKGVFPGTAEMGNTPYFLDIRIIKVDTPSFSIRMSVDMNVIWTLYRVAGKTELLHENIHSTYTGGMFEGGIHGANRVRVAMEGAMRENIRIGVEMLEALDIEQEPGPADSEPAGSEQEFAPADAGQEQE